MNTNIFVGSYSEKGEDGIYCYNLNEENNKLELVSKTNLIENPSYITLSKDKKTIYSVSEIYEFQGEKGGAVAALSYKNQQYELLDLKATNGQAPCHVLLDEINSKLYVSNYFGGSIAMYNIEDDSKLNMCDFVKHVGCGPNKERQEAAHMHFCGFIGDKVCGCDLGIDTIKCYDTSSGKFESVTDIKVDKGAGVRHFIVSNTNENLIFALCELSSEVVVIKKSGEDFEIIQVLSTLPEGFTENICAAIKQSANGKYIFASNRGHHSLAMYEVIDEKLKLVKIIDTKGETPRDFLVLENHIIVANQDSNNIVVFTFEENTGEVEFTGTVVECKSPVCVVK